MRLGTLMMMVLWLTACAQRGPICTKDAMNEAVEQSLRSGGTQQAVALDMEACTADPAALERSYQAIACTPRGGWLLGLGGGLEPGKCEALDRWWYEGYRLGKDYQRLRQELSALDGRADGDQQMQRVKLVRELDAIRGVAQIKDWPLPDES